MPLPLLAASPWVFVFDRQPFDRPVDREVGEQYSYAGRAQRNFLMRSLRNAPTEMAINVLACSMKRVMALVGVSALAAMITP
jgi:hypothetical protein